MCPGIVTKKIPCLFFIRSQVRSLYICCGALYHSGVVRPHKAELTSCSSFSESNVCSIASVESNFTHVSLYAKKLPIISTASMNICGCKALLKIRCNHFCKSCFQKGEKHAEREGPHRGLRDLAEQILIRTLISTFHLPCLPWHPGDLCLVFTEEETEAMV